VTDREELAAWLRLLETPQVGRESARRLLAAFGSAQGAIDATVAERREVVHTRAANALAQAPESFDSLLEVTLRWLEDPSQPARAFVPLDDPRYPRMLLETADPPLAIYLQGRAALLQRASLAIVGSRNPTPQGLANARAFASHLSGAGITVVSGLALGIDASAHEGGLEGAGSTIAVVGTGLDDVYPRQHRALATRIAEHGLLVSEYSLGTPPLAAHFPERNRIIAGLSRGTLVVEAALQSGSLITARLAAEAGRDVFAIPGSIHAPQSRGCHALLKQGAKLVEVAADVLEEMQMPAPVASAGTPPGPQGASDPLLDALGFDPIGLDALVARTGIAAGELGARLLELELEGRVARLAGQLFQRVERG
jgi:DNA processing protein